MTTEPTASWSMLTSVGESLNQDMFLTATQGTISSFILDPKSKIVGASTDVVLKWKGTHAVPKGSYF